MPASGYAWTTFTANEQGAWIRLRASRDLTRATAFLSYRNVDKRQPAAETKFAALARDDSPSPVGGLLYARGGGKKTLGVTTGGQFHELGEDLVLRPGKEPGAATWMQTNVAIPADAIAEDAASIIYTDETGRRFRLPRGREGFRMDGPLGPARACREVCTERDLLNAGGTFFELPAENAGGVAKLRPVATHNRRIHDYASWRGLLVLTGLAGDTRASDPRVIRSADGSAAVWLGSVDELWGLGKPVGVGGPWKDTAVKAGEPSDPYLMTGYDRKRLTLAHRADRAVRMRIEVDLTGNGHWAEYATLEVPPGLAVPHVFPDGYQAYWLRVTADTATTATAWMVYE